MKIDRETLPILLLPYDGTVMNANPHRRRFVLSFPNIYNAASFESDMTEPQEDGAREPVCEEVELTGLVATFYDRVLVTIVVSEEWWER